MYPKILGKTQFRHVPKTGPDVRNTTISPAQFLGVDQALGTCAFVIRLKKLTDHWLSSQFGAANRMDNQ